MSAYTPTLYLAWQDAKSRRWFPVGRLRLRARGDYEFVYTRGYESAIAAGMQPIIGFAEADRRYVSTALFPLFQNRVMSQSREEYGTYLSRLGLDADANEPLLILARSEGRRDTDSFVLFPEPLKVERAQQEPEYCVSFFIHGVSHVPVYSQERAAQLKEGERVWLMWDWQNQHDPDAITIRSDDNYILGWVPRFYTKDLQQLRQLGAEASVTVRRVNAATTPYWSRVLCSVSAPWPSQFQAFAHPLYEPLAGAASSEP